MGRLYGYNEILCSYETLQFKDYSRYDMNLFSFSEGNTGVISGVMKNATETWWTDANGNFHLDGNARRWCYNDMEACPNYKSFYKEKVLYKSYVIVDNGKANLTYENKDETTMTNMK